MNLPDISVWNAGVTHDETSFNDVSYALNFLLTPPEAEVNQTAAQSIPTGTATATAITFDTVTKDNDGMWDAGHPTYLTIQTPGWYEAEWAVVFAAKSDATLRSVSLYTNGAFGIASAISYNEYMNDSGSNTPEVWCSYDLFLNTGDTVSVGILQSTGSALSTASSGSDATAQTFLRLRWASL